MIGNARRETHSVVAGDEVALVVGALYAYRNHVHAMTYARNMGMGRGLARRGDTRIYECRDYAGAARGARNEFRQSAK